MSAQEKEWIPIENSLPEVSDDFETTMETQQISKPVWIKLSGGRRNKATGTDEIDAHYVVKNGTGMWSLDPCASSQYYPLALATHWRYQENI